jgi:hypothetical protein
MKHNPLSMLADSEARCRPSQDCPQQWKCARRLACIQPHNAIVVDYSITFVSGTPCEKFMDVPKRPDAP